MHSVHPRALFRVTLLCAAVSSALLGVLAGCGTRQVAAMDTATVAIFWTEDVEIRRGLGSLVLGRHAYKRLFNPDSEAVARGEVLIYQRLRKVMPLKHGVGFLPRHRQLSERGIRKMKMGTFALQLSGTR